MGGTTWDRAFKVTCSPTIASKAGMSLAEMALRYALSLPGGTGILTGVETVAQMEENALMARRVPDPATPSTEPGLYPWSLRNC